jgi:parallel beta-helix repeat protein
MNRLNRRLSALSVLTVGVFVFFWILDMTHVDTEETALEPVAADSAAIGNTYIPKRSGSTAADRSNGFVNPSAPTDIDVIIRLGDNIQAAVDNNPPGTTFLLESGIHRRQSIIPKPDDVFIGEPGATLDGEGVAKYAIYAHSGPVTNVTIRGLIIEGYATPLQQGSVGGGGAHHWLIEANEIRFSAGGGVGVGSGMIVRSNHIHHNEQIGLIANGARAAVIDANEISYNNSNSRIDPNWEAGGSKFLKTVDLVLRDNYVHHNVGPGLWLDTDNIDALYVGNIVSDNTGHGIFHEVSYRATIRDNIAERNGKAGIWIANSPDVEVYGNHVAENVRFGIAASQDNRGDGAHGAHDVNNLFVHDNFIVMTSGWTGLQQQVGDNSFFTDRNNRFEHNTYDLGNGSRYYRWRGKLVTKDQWIRYGNDVDGTWLG